MKQYFALFLISALVVSASAKFDFKAASDLSTGFTYGMNYPELNPSFDTCSVTVNQTKQALNASIQAIEAGNLPKFAETIAQFGQGFSQSIKDCGKTVRLSVTLFDTLIQDIQAISPDSFTARIFAHMVTYTQAFKDLKAYISEEQFFEAGKDAAIIAKTFILDGQDFPTKKQVEMEMFSLQAKIPTAFYDDLSNFLLGVHGFIEQANTTIVVDHFDRFIADTNHTLSQIPAIEQALDDQNYPAIITAITEIYKSIGALKVDSVQLKNELTSFIQRDLPLFNSQEKAAKAVQALLNNLPMTIMNVQRISNGIKNKDFKEVGKGCGAVYNQLRDGAMQP